MVELVNVDPRPGRASIDHERVLDEREVGRVRRGTVHGCEWVGVGLWRGGYYGGRGDRRGGGRARIERVKRRARLRLRGYFSLWWWVDVFQSRRWKTWDAGGYVWI